MPLYVYECNPCKKTIEELKSYHEVHNIPVCEKIPCSMQLKIFPATLDFRGDWMSTTGKLDVLEQTERDLAKSEKYVDLNVQAQKNLSDNN